MIVSSPRSYRPQVEQNKNRENENNNHYYRIPFLSNRKVIIIIKKNIRTHFVFIEFVIRWRCKIDLDRVIRADIIINVRDARWRINDKNSFNTQKQYAFQ